MVKDCSEGVDFDMMVVYPKVERLVAWVVDCLRVLADVRFTLPLDCVW